MGIHGTSKTSTYVGQIYHLMDENQNHTMDANNTSVDSIQEFLPSKSFPDSFNPFYVLKTDSTLIPPDTDENADLPNYSNATSFEGFKSSDIFKKNIFEYGKNIINTFLLSQTSSSGSQLRISDT